MKISQVLPIIVTPEKIYPFLKKANEEQRETLYLLASHMIRGTGIEAERKGPEDFKQLLKEGSNRQRMLILQAAFHIVQRERMQDTF